MCTWITELPSQTRTGETPAKPNLMVYIKPTPPKEYYRFRLLGFKSSKSERDYPFISRFLHTVWVEDSDGKHRTESVVCPVTPFVKTKWNGDPINDCPICKFANANFNAWKTSNWKDKESAKKSRTFGRKFEALIPVYVINDPIYPQNNGHFRVFAFYDKKQYESFTKLVKEKTREAVVFNGKNALDFYIRYEMIDEVFNKGEPNEYVWKHPVLKQMGFTNKAYDIPQITKESIDQFPFDETYYVSSTITELQEFFNRHIKVSNDDIPDEDDDISIIQTKQTKNIIKNTNSIEKTELSNISNISNKNDEETIHSIRVSQSQNDIDIESEIDEMLNEDDSSNDKVNTTVNESSNKKDEILESPPDPLKNNGSTDEDLDDLLKDII